MTPGPEGYAFHWYNCKPPYLERMADGVKIHCTLENYIPYVYEENGAICTVTVGASASSSSSREVPRDDDSDQLARVEPDAQNGVNLGHAESGGNQPLSNVEQNSNVPPPPNGCGQGDDITLLELEAKSLYHMLTHTPKNKHCKACVRAKMQFKHHRRHQVSIAERAEAESFGDLITGDHIVTIEKMD
jgi:hypothetical protein